MPGGRPPKPKAIKISQGTFRPDRERPGSAPPVKAAPVKCPGWMPAGAKKEWKRVAPILQAAGLLTAADAAALASYCIAVDDIEQATAVIESEGRFYETDKGQRKPHPAVAVRAAAMQAVRQLAALFGLDPADRGRMRVPDGPPAEPSGKSRYFKGA